MSRMIRSAERGAVALIVAVLFGGGVLTGVGAIVVDVGAIYAEREELQSGADAAATAVAKACIANAATCTQTQRDTRAAKYANSNAKDGSTAVVAVCGRGFGLPACPSDPGNLTACIGEVPATGNYVEVRTGTRLGDGSTLLPPSFAGAFAGREGFDGTEIRACARVATTPGGSPNRMVAPGVTVEKCYHTSYTSNGASYPTTERVLYLKDGKNADPCTGTSSNGANGPGNFGWLDHQGGCKATFDLTTGFYGGDTGNNTEASCEYLIDWYIDNATPMPLPLFDATSDNGKKFQYHLAGFSAFMVTGYKLSGASRESRVSHLDLCSGSERCLYGYFVKATAPILDPGGPSLGLTGQPSVKLIG
jgi:hypothetical protein